MKKALFILTLAAVTFFIACSKKASPAKVKLTTYTVDIAPLLQAKCAPCHMPSKNGRKADFENYESAKRHATQMLDRVLMDPGQRGFMPFKKTMKLSDSTIAVFKQWRADGLLEK